MNKKEGEIKMANLTTPFRYDYVGSFLRPEKLKKARILPIAEEQLLCKNIV